MSQTQLHQWEPTGVTGYPITHPIVGQTDFFEKFKSYLQLVGREDNPFAHVFAIVATWGVGKSRLGYEVIAQVNGASKGWKIRGPGGRLQDARLFDSDAERERHLALYIRYSQVAHPLLNLDNWFAPAVYKALAPLARGQFDNSIQHQIARQAHSRLLPTGFDPGELAEAMELGQHDEEAIYSDTALATRLCDAAYQVLRKYGIEYVVVVLDELETAAERAGTPDADEARTMDGRAITMLRKAIEDFSKAVKEEDARARFPWLRFLALCSPAIGDELKEVQSTDRRFEIMDLAPNAFSDVSAFVSSLEAEGRLLRPYPKGLVEAAYMMSGGNFGWFNVIMAVADQVLHQLPAKEKPTINEVFERALRVSARISRYVLDHRCLDELNLSGELREAAAKLIFGQEPVPLASLDGETLAELLAATNAYGEPVAIRYQRADWRRAQSASVLIQNRFQRRQGTGEWLAPGIPEPINLEHLLDDLATLAIHEEDRSQADGEYTLLLPQSLADFLQLLDLIHPHPAAEEVGRTLWNALVGDTQLPPEQATHVGPSVEMLRRLDIRLRKSSTGTVFRDPEENEQYDRVVDARRPSAGERALCVLTGAMRLLDANWNYDPEPAGLGDDILAIRTPKKQGLLDCMALALHPKKTAVFAWANSNDQLEQILDAIPDLHRGEGRLPLVVFTTDYGLPERFATARLAKYEKARDYTVILHLNSGEEAALESIGLPTSAWQGFRLRLEGFTTRFSERLNRLKTPALKKIHDWRHRAGDRGCIAWPLRPKGNLKPEQLGLLLEGWRRCKFDKGDRPLGEVGTLPRVDVGELLDVIGSLGLSPAAAPKGYTPDDNSGLWLGEGESARPGVPPFMLRSVAMWLFRNPDKELTDKVAKENWLWGYTWDGNRTTDIFREWMSAVVAFKWAEALPQAGGRHTYRLIPRAGLQSNLSAAKNWLERVYPTIVRQITDVLGTGLVNTRFAPSTGTRYQAAVKRLKDAETDLGALDALEANPPDLDDMDAACDWFARATSLRLRIAEAIDWVYKKDDYDRLSSSLDEHKLDLDSDDKPLWEQIRQAKNFTAAVQTTAKRIRDRVPQVGEEIRQAVAGIGAFPISLFTRPLAKLHHIVDAGLAGEDPNTSTERAQHATVGTLAYHLKDLRVADALRVLDALAAEVGVHRDDPEDLPLEEIRGEIGAGFRDLKGRYGRAYESILDLETRVNRLDAALADSPRDFSPPTDAGIDRIKAVPARIREGLEATLDDAVEELLDEHDGRMNLGEFGPLMREARRQLLQAPEGLLKTLEGRVRTLENAVSQYRQDLVSRPKLLATRAALNAALRAKRMPEETLLQVADIEEMSLKDGLTHVLGRIQLWSEKGNDLLATAGVTFEQWRELVSRMQNGQDPQLAADKMDALVDQGFVRRTYALAGGAQ